MITSRRDTLLSLGLLCMLVSASCTSDTSSQASKISDSAGERSHDSRTLTVQVDTYNVGLARGFVDYASERRPLIIDALADALAAWMHCNAPEREMPTEGALAPLGESACNS